MAGMVDQAIPEKPFMGERPGASPADPPAAKWLAKQYAALQSLVRRAGRPSTPSELIGDAMPLAAEVLEADLWSFAQVVGGKKLVIKAYPAGSSDSLDQSARAAAHTVPLDPEQSLAGKALDAQGPISVSDLQLSSAESDPFMSKLGVRAGLVVPILLAGEPFGTVGVYRRREQPFSADETAFLESVAHCLATAIVRFKSDAALDDQRRFVSALLETIDTLVLVLDVDGNVEAINRACRELSGFTLPEIRDKPFCSVFAVPEEEELFRNTFRRSVNNKQGCRFESTLLGKDGAKHHICWALKVVVDKQAFVQAILLTGTDQTEYVNACERLAQAEAAAQEANAAVRELRRQLADQPLQRRSLPEQRQEGPTPVSSTTPDHKGAEAPAPGSPQERRRSPRRPYHYRQLIAPIVDGRMPAMEDFIEVECEDISAGGVAFHYPERPTFKQLVVALGQAPFMTHFKAEVVRVVDESDESRTRFLVGCRFTGRVYL